MDADKFARILFEAFIGTFAVAIAVGLALGWILFA